MRRIRAEDTIQRAIFQHFERRSAPGVYAWHTPNGGRRSPIEGAIFKSLGVKAGIPDILALREGTLYALELKAPGGRATDRQLAAIQAMSRAGAICAIKEGLDAALDWLEEHELLRGHTG